MKDYLNFDKVKEHLKKWNIREDDNGKGSPCEACLKEKAHRRSYAQSKSHASNIGDLVHADI